MRPLRAAAGAVIAVDLYGEPADYQEIQETSRIMMCR